MNPAGGIMLMAIGALIAVFLNTTIGIILGVVGLLLLLLSFGAWGPSRRKTVIIERDRPVRTVRERETKVVRESDL